VVGREGGAVSKVGAVYDVEETGVDETVDGDAVERDLKGKRV
jgi:hypothetical protein